MNHLTLGSRFPSGCGIKLFLGNGQRYWSSNTRWELTVRISFRFFPPEFSRFGWFVEEQNSIIGLGWCLSQRRGDSGSLPS